MTNLRNRLIRRDIDRLKDDFGGVCWNCGSSINVQFAHVEETGLSGMGRGRKERYYDIINNPTAYALLCGGEDRVSGCHKAFDLGMIKLSDFFERGEKIWLKNV